MTVQAPDFVSFANIILGVVVGVLVGIPPALMHGGSITLLAAPLFGVLGGVSGYRHRRSRGFLYLALVAILVLSSLIFSGLAVNRP